MCTFVINICMTSTIPNQAQFSLPVFNINGTSASSIEYEYDQAMKALRIAEQLLVNCTVHGRDFQMQSRSAYLKPRANESRYLHIVKRSKTIWRLGISTLLNRTERE